MQTLRSIVAAAAVLAATTAASAAPAHEHGVARLSVAVEPQRISIVLNTPLDNVVGFERAPRTDAERSRVEAALARLKDGAALFRFAAAAGCVAPLVAVRAPVLDGTATTADGHAELEAQYDFDCSAAAKAGAMDVGLFAALPALRRIDLQIATPRGQVGARLAKPASRVQLLR